MKKIQNTNSYARKVFFACLAFFTFHFSLFTFSSCERIKDAPVECGVWLEFVFDLNMEYVDSFASQARTVDVYVFNSRGKFVEARHATTEQLVGRKRMFIDGLSFGDYKILTLVNHDPEHFAASQTTLTEARLSLKHDGVVACRFDHLFAGPTVEVKYNADKNVYRVPLVRQTNQFNVVLQSSARAAHTVDIEAPEAGCYNCDNLPTDRRRTVYRPWSLDHQTDRSAARLNTMRLLEDEPEGYRIVVRSDDATRGPAAGAELWSTDLLTLLSATKPATRPDGTPLPCAEYYDREGNWNIVIVHRGGGDSDEGFVALQIMVNGWVVWQNPIEV